MPSTAPQTDKAAEEKARAATSDRPIAENRLGQRLVAPAVILMLLVTA